MEEIAPEEKFVKGNNIQLSVNAGSREEAEKLFNGLSAGGEVTMPLQDTFWVPTLGCGLTSSEFHGWLIMTILRNSSNILKNKKSNPIGLLFIL